MRSYSSGRVQRTCLVYFLILRLYQNNLMNLLEGIHKDLILQLYQSYKSITKKVAPVITNLYNYDVDYFYNPVANEGYYLGEYITRKLNADLYEIFLESCTDLEEWEILKAGKRFEYKPIDPEPEIDPDAPDPPTEPPMEEDPQPEGPLMP